MLYPHLRTGKILNAWFLDMIPCPLGAVRSATISCRRVASKDGKMTCEVSLATGSMSSGNPRKKCGCRLQGRGWFWGTEMKYRKKPRIRSMSKWTNWTRPGIDAKGFSDQYARHSDLQGRYRDGHVPCTGPGRGLWEVGWPMVKKTIFFIWKMPIISTLPIFWRCSFICPGSTGR